MLKSMALIAVFLGLLPFLLGLLYTRFVEEDKEYEAIAAIFEEIMDDVDFE